MSRRDITREMRLMENFNSCCCFLQYKQQTSYNHGDELYMVISNPIYAPMDYNKTNHFSHGTQMVTIGGYPPVKMSDIRNVAGGSTPDAISEYYKGGPNISSENQFTGTLPTSGVISFSDFYNLHADMEEGYHAGSSTTRSATNYNAYFTTVSIYATSTNTQYWQFSVSLHRLQLTWLKQAPVGTPDNSNIFTGNSWSGTMVPGQAPVTRRYMYGKVPYSQYQNYIGYACLTWTNADGVSKLSQATFSEVHN